MYEGHDVYIFSFVEVTCPILRVVYSLGKCLIHYDGIALLVKLNVVEVYFDPVGLSHSRLLSRDGPLSVTYGGQARWASP